MIKETYTLITGARSGIGRAMAHYCGSRGINLLLVSLPGKDLKDVSEIIRKKFNIKVDYFEIDLSLSDAPLDIFNWVKKNNYPVNILINNAGIGGTVLFEKSDLEYNDYRILLNIRALVALTSLFIPVLKEHEKSFILNVSSLSAFFSIPYKSLYSATKAFVFNFSRGLRYELKNTSISVSVLCPNGVRTNADTSSRINAHGNMGRLTSMSPDKVAAIAVDGMLKGKFLIIPGFINRVLLLITKIIPIPFIQKILALEFSKEIRSLNPDNLL